MNSFHSFSQHQNIPDQLPHGHQEEESQAPFVQTPSNRPLRTNSQTESGYNYVTSEGSLVRALSNPVNLNGHIRISGDEDRKHQEFQRQRSSAEDEKDQFTSDERFRDDSIAYYRREIQENRNQSRSSLNFYKNCRCPSRAADEAFEEHLQCEEKISHFHNMCGHMLTKQYRYQDAVLEFQKASNIRNRVVSEYIKWADQLNTPKDKAYAWKKYEDAEKYESYFTQIFGNWGWALTRLKEYNLAIQKYTEALEADQKMKDMCKRWGYAFAQTTNFKAARDKCLCQIYRNWGYTLSQQEKWEEALQKYGQINQLNGRENKIYTDMGYCYDKLGDQDKAVEYYLKAIESNQNSPDILSEAYYLWGRILDEKGEHPEAITKLKEASRLENLVNERKGKKVIIKSSNRLYLVYYKLKRYGEALNGYQELIDDHPRYAYVYIYVGLIYAQIAYRKSKGEEYLDDSKTDKIKKEENYPKLATKNFNKGIEIYKENLGFNDDCVNAIEREIERNEKLLKTAPQNNDESRMIIVMMEIVLQKVLDLELIQEDLLNDKEPQAQNFENQLRSLVNCSSHFDLDLSNVSRNQIEDSMIFEDLDSVKPNHADQQRANIEKYIRHYKAASQNWSDSFKRNPRQEKSLKRHIKLELDISSIYSNWGYQLSALHNYEEALAKFEEAKTRIDTLTNLCRIGLTNKMHICYIEANKGYRISKQLSGIFKNWGFALSRLGRFEQAEEKYRNALEKNPKFGLAHKNLGFVLYRLGKYFEAIQSYEKAFQYCPDSNKSKILLYIGSSHTMLGEFTKAYKIYKSIINDESQKDSIKCDAYYEWANTLDEEGDSEGALNKLQQALLLHESGEDKKFVYKVLNRKGLLHYHREEYPQAETLFKEIISHDPSYGFAYINLGLVHNQMDRAKCKDEIEAYERTVAEISNVLKNLETNKNDSLLQWKWDDQEEKYNFYEQAIVLVQESSFLRQDYIDIYKREAKKIENKKKKKEEELIAKMKAESQNVDPKDDFNNSLLGTSLEMQGQPLGF